jgi:hypothetical protein
MLLLLTTCQPPPAPVATPLAVAVDPCQEQHQTVVDIVQSFSFEGDVPSDETTGKATNVANELHQQRLMHFFLLQNLVLEQAQNAFDRLTTCRLQQAASIRTRLANGQIDRGQAISDLSVAHGMCGQDVRAARRVIQAANTRAEQMIASTAETLPVPPLPPAMDVVASNALMQINPHPDAPPVGRVSANEEVTVSNERNGYALITAARGARGYVPLTVMHHLTTLAATPPAAPLQTLTGSNAARRDAFTQSVSVMEYTAGHGGFELSPGI